MIYLDSAATYPVLPWAKQAFEMAPFGNPSSEHAAGRAAREALEDARARIAQCIGADADEVYFCSGATEACNWAIESMRDSVSIMFGNPLEHNSVFEPIKYCRECEGKMKGITGEIRMLANNETGEIFDMPSLGRGDLIFSDATAAVGHIPVNFHKLGVNYMAFAAHKFGGIPGIGALVVKKGAPLSTMIRGGGQERGKRGGTESVALACAMAAALEWQTSRMEENQCELTQLWELLFEELNNIPKMRVNTPQWKRKHMPHILNVSFEGVNGHALACMLSERHNIMVSAGAACSSGTQEPSRVLMVMYQDKQRAAGGVRISLSIDNTRDDCEQAAKAIAECVGILRKIS